METLGGNKTRTFRVVTETVIKGIAALKKAAKWLSIGFFLQHEKIDSPDRYLYLRRKIIILMFLLTIVPLTLMAVINYHQYRTSLKTEIINPMHVLANKTKHSFELFLDERLSTVKFISSAYSFEDLSNEKTLTRLFRVMKTEIGGFVDLGLVDSRANMVSYAGPYEMMGKNYSQQGWFHEVQLKGVYISDVFMGYRKFPHIAIAVQRFTRDDTSWILRATIDTDKFEGMISAMGLEPASDAFLVNSEGIFQTGSKFYGKVLDRCPLAAALGNYGTNVTETVDPKGRKILMAYTPLSEYDYTLVIIKPQSVILKSWYTMKSEMFFIFFIGLGLIIVITLKLSNNLVKNIREADEKRESAFRELEHTQKLSSIGRLAAGVAHEINNPLAIINEKAGLMKDLVSHGAKFRQQEKFISLTDSILKSVKRCKTITHRLLGFARRMEVQVEALDVNGVVSEVLGFLEKEALYRNIETRLHLAENLPQISSDRGQISQVLLNIVTNAIASIEGSGWIAITTWQENENLIGISIQDNGCGMSEETIQHIFEPFFTTKRGYGTGLGLPITYGIITKLGGDIKVRSKEGEGTTFTIFLPTKPKAG
ncbi:MAG: two-component sensor histidine kinase [Deltaproteobacteria bacterium]|nr:two-component sensor histidine kinase [Deltaproteobacteria bacterium]